MDGYMGADEERMDERRRKEEKGEGRGIEE